jgi:hypothetical protein
MYFNQKVHQQVNRPAGPKAHPKHLEALAQARLRPRVRVEPVNEEQRHVLRHPNGTAFRPTGSAEWPMDRFTQRRLRDGSIKIVEEIVDGRRQQPMTHADRQERQTNERQERSERQAQASREKPSSTE